MLIKKLFSLITLLLLSSVANAQGTTTSNFTANASLNGSCEVSAQNIDLVSTLVKSSLLIQNKILIKCSKGLPFVVGITSPHTNSTDLQQHYLIGSDPLNTDKIAFTFFSVLGGASFATYPNDGSPGHPSISNFIGSGTAQNIGTALRISIAGSVNNGTFYSNNFKVTPDTYSSTVTIVLTY